MITHEKYGAYKKLIYILSVAIPLVVASLLGIRTKVYLGEWTKVLPHVIGTINTLTAIALILGLSYIRQNNRVMHEKMMKIAFYLGAVFLVAYVTYHMSNESTSSGYTGIILWIYYFILITHILLSIGVVPLVLLSLFYALTGQYQEHKKMVKYSFPIWLYVSMSGVIVYLMILPFYK